MSNPMTVGEYLSYIMDRLNSNPEISSQPLYSENGILFGWEDHEDTARRFDVSEYVVRVMVNQGYLEGIKSNDHLIIPKNAQMPLEKSYPTYMEEYYDETEHAGLISDE